MDRFSEQSVYDLSRAFRQAREETHLRDAGDEPENLIPACQARERIVGYSDSVSELAEDLKKHDLVCRICNPSLVPVRLSPAVEDERGTGTRKKAA